MKSVLKVINFDSRTYVTPFMYIFSLLLLPVCMLSFLLLEVLRIRLVDAIRLLDGLGPIAPEFHPDKVLLDFELASVMTIKNTIQNQWHQAAISTHPKILYGKSES